MATHIVITSHKAGQTWLYEEINKQGKKKLVPTYWANLERSDGTLFWFAVTRDSAQVIFGSETIRYLSGGECPPSRHCHPYLAKLQSAPRNGLCLLLYEARDDIGYFLQGNLSVKRRSILIHPGPATSFGCFGVAGGRRGWKHFWQVLKVVTNNFCPSAQLYVHVESRS